jgi:ABC-type uncharacterized transport system fused permease/ATPase subunit
MEAKKKGFFFFFFFRFDCFFFREIEYGVIAQGGRAFRECFDAFSVVVQNMASLTQLVVKRRTRKVILAQMGRKKGSD